MEKLILILILLSFEIIAFGQELQRPESSKSETQRLSFKQYHLVYPQDALEAEIEGTITVTFDVDSACHIINRKQDITLGYGCDEAAQEALDRLENDYRKENGYRCEPRRNAEIPISFELPIE
ncbi:MAG: energy transducer TonB [Cryomorphaceae bacterium]